MLDKQSRGTVFLKTEFSYRVRTKSISSGSKRAISTNLSIFCVCVFRQTKTERSEISTYWRYVYVTYLIDVFIDENERYVQVNVGRVRVRNRKIKLYASLSLHYKF